MDNFYIPSTSTPLLPHIGVTLLNLTNFKYIIDNDVCDTSAGSDLKAILVITSYVGNVHVRQAHRRAMPKTSLFSIGVRRVFLLAISHGSNDEHYRKVKQKEVVKENELNSDLVQGNFHEAYRNLTYKHVMGLQWVTSFCRKAQYIIKMDDDIIVDVYFLMKLLQVSNVSGSFMLGYILNGVKPSRNPSNKWFVNYVEYPKSFYPPFLSGWMYVTTPAVATEIIDYVQNRWQYKYPRKVKEFQSFFWIDDVFVTGIIAQQLKIQLIDLSRYFAVHPQHFLCCIETALIERLKRKDEAYIFPCDYIVGPSGGNMQLLSQVLKEAENCWKAEENCIRHLNVSQGNKCTVGRAEAYDWIRRPSQEGKATLKEIKL
ncbi:hypothetical protein J437_LFUL014006 [Ladona fulva]|uniref:Hexosyltransferase n=1 Tax=Ladona fulva TaxID=123851 RepID=A0A8K0P662_LADFU|nr:hypothetical protein J437_LFUL014006 [Ladona fulva]